MKAQYRHGTVADLHALEMPTGDKSEQLWVMRPTAAAIAMGSAQRAEQFDQERLTEDHVALASRRSGGGAVFIDPASTVWIDLLAPRSSAWWSGELTENFLLVGRVWQRALSSIGVESEMCMTASPRTEVASQACWAGTGWGEVTIGDAKVVGLSQRRTRWGVRVQTMAVLDDSSRRVAEYLPVESRAQVHASIGVITLSVTIEEVEAAVVAAFRDHRPELD